jgi:hypothetical protein
MTRVHLPEGSRAHGGRRLLLLATVPLLVLPLTLAACGGSSAGPGDHPTGKNEVVLQFSTGGGFVTIETSLTQIPRFTLCGDGTVVVTGPMIEIYPQPALPNLQTTTISQDAVEEILSAAQEAGLFANNVDYGQPGISDMPTTTITINAGGQTYTSAIYALGAESGAGGLTMEQEQARAAITQLSGQLTDLTAFQPGEIQWEPYAYTALAVYSTPVDPSTGTDNTEVQPNRLEWPLGDLSTLGEAVQPEGYRKVVVSGDDLATLQPLLSQATQITLWTYGDSEYHLSFRPLLPNETT